jgi:hypothetical protein
MRRPRHRKSSVNSNSSIIGLPVPHPWNFAHFFDLVFAFASRLYKNVPTFFNSLFLEQLFFSFAVYLYLCATIYCSTTLMSIYVSLHTEILYICHSFLLYIRNICISYTSLNASEFQNSQYKTILFHFCHSSYNNAHAILSPILLSYSSMKVRISCLPFSLYCTAVAFLHT